MKSKCLWALVTLCAVLAVSCEPPVVEEFFNSDSKTTYELTSEETSFKMDFETNCNWSISCEDPWLSFSPAEGESGTHSVEVKVSANDTWEARSAKFELTYGSQSPVVYEVNQDFTHILEFDTEIQVGAASGEYVVALNYTDGPVEVNVVEGSDWLSVVETKAAPVKASYKVVYKANRKLEERSGKITFVTADGSLNFIINQAVATDAMELESVLYISNSECPYDMNSWTPGKFQEWVLDFKTTQGNLRLAINGKSENPLGEIPTGEFEVDAEDSHAEGTVSIAGNKYYSCILIGSEEIAVSDCFVEIVKEEENYSIALIYLDLDENRYEHTFYGTLPQIEEKTDVVYAYVTKNFDYNTYFANKANETYLILTPAKSSSDEVYCHYLTYTFYTSELAEVLAEGNFEYTDEYPTSVDLSYANGIYNYLPGKIYDFTVYSPDYDDVLLNNPKLSISKNENGNYDITFSFEAGKALIYERDENGDKIYDEDYNYVVKESVEIPAFEKSFSDVVIPIENVSENLRPCPDTDDVFTSVMTTQHIYFGKPYVDAGVDGNLYVISFASVNGVYTVNIPFVDDGSWVFEGNGQRPDLCVTPFTPGTYTVERGYTPKNNCIAYLKTGNYAATVRNSYTGSYYRISKGSVTIDGETNMATFDIYGKPANSETELHFTGSLSASSLPYGARYLSDARYDKYKVWFPEPVE